MTQNLLKCARNNFGSWRIFGNVVRLRYEYRSTKNFGKAMIDEYTYPGSDLFVWLRNDEDCKREGCTKTAGTILVLMFRADDDREYVIMTHWQTYLMNDKGRTIERLRDCAPNPRIACECASCQS